MRTKAVRFKDLAVGQQFRIDIGGSMALATKTTPTELMTPKLNSPGTITIQIDPELNQDDCFPID